MIRAAPRRLDLGFGGATSRTARARSSGAWMLSRSGETEMVSGFRGRKARAALARRRATAPPASESSEAMAGGGSVKRWVRESRRGISAFYECHLVDLF